MLKRHAGALGLSCLIDAFPYEVPKWMPAVLIELAELISDPVPIQVSLFNVIALQVVFLRPLTVEFCSIHILNAFQ